MEVCLACGKTCKGFSINDSFENVQIRTLITFYLHRETTPGSLISNFLCTKCVEILWNCHRIRMKAHEMHNYRAVKLELNPFAQTFHPADTNESISGESDDESTLIQENSTTDLESSSESGDEFEKFTCAISMTSTDITSSNGCNNQAVETPIKQDVKTKTTQDDNKDVLASLFFIHIGG